MPEFNARRLTPRSSRRGSTRTLGIKDTDMADRKNLTEKLDELVEAHREDRPDALREFLATLQENYVSCRKAEARQFALLILLWIAAILVAFDAIAEAQFTTVKLRDAKSLLLLAPPALGFFGHNLIVSYMHTINLWQAISRLYKYVLPKAYELDLELLAAPPSFVDLARSSLASNRNFATNWWPVLVGVLILLLPGLVLAHTSYMLYTASFSIRWLPIASAAIGILLWLHALALAWGSIVVSEG